MWAFDCNKSQWPWMTLNVNLQLCRPWYAYIDQTAEAKIMQFSLKCSPRSYLFACQVRLRISKGILLIGWLNQRWGGFWLREAIPRKRCEIELRWQLITDRKLYMGFRLQQKSMTLNDLEWWRIDQLLSVVLTSCVTYTWHCDCNWRPHLQLLLAKTYKTQKQQHGIMYRLCVTITSKNCSFHNTQYSCLFILFPITCSCYN